ncbi:MAG: alpha,alpha-trehalose-phosphate synthase (UDP-forming) [Alphaproteobacteria bacterium]|nr:alpha,alpha-trehalose-phosphate synthase (UDP-forming) [Alphaproteobacteria bacterium]
MSRLIAVSNRVSPPRDIGQGSVGGLAMALSAMMRETSGVWFGWSGRTTDTFTGHLDIERIGAMTVATVDLEAQDVEEYYNGYANKSLWPLFHYRIDLTDYDKSFDVSYRRVNERFARTLAPLLQSDDVIWVHDYHLFLLGRELRRLGVTNRIGFFLHIPWPSRQLLTTLPRHRDLVDALFDYDLIGFQAQDWMHAFKGYVENEIGGLIEDGVAHGFGKSMQVGVFPIGIDAEAFLQAGHSDAALETFARMRNSLAGRQMILGVDRLDYSKGLEERFLAYERFLSDTPEARERVFLLQIATPSRDEVEAYQDMRASLDAAAGRINGEYATFDWVPIRYVNTAYRRDELAGIYRAARAALITPLRDGMNLVAKEYVAAQDPDDPGVLILSRFAGAASQMREALIVNPFSREQTAEAIAKALTMGLEERKRRHAALLEGVVRDNVMAWSRDFVRALSSVTR